MAAFPAPALWLQNPLSLQDVLRWCRDNTLASQYAEHSLTIAVALRQLEQFLNTIYRHPGRIVLGGGTGVSWPTPYDCLLTFAEWRQTFTAALSQIRTPSFFDPQWLSEDVITLRDAIAAERAFDRLPVLADALEEAGCDNPLILTHLRDGSEHAHHCWVIALLAS